MGGVMDEAVRLQLVRSEQPRTCLDRDKILRKTQREADRLAQDGRTAAVSARDRSEAAFAAQPTSSRRPQSGHAGYSHASTSSSAFDKHHMRSDRHGDTQDMTKNFECVAHLAEELDGLFAEMGRQTAVIRAGHRSRLRLIANVARTVEVKLPRRAEETEEFTVQMESKCDPHYHSNEDEGLRRGLVSEEHFDIFVAESQRQVPDGPFRTQSLGKANHRIRFTTDFSSLFVCLFSKKECHLEFFCKVWQGTQNNVGMDRGGLTNLSADDDDDDQHLIGPGASVGMKLQVKLKARRQDMKDQKTFAGGFVSTMAATSSPSNAAAPTSPVWLPRSQTKGRHLNDFIWDGSAAPHDERQTVEAKKRLVNLWMGHCSPSTGKVLRAKGQWVHKLSSDAPRKIIKFLRKAVQDRSALTTIAVAGAFEFVLKRQRELHLMRARTAMRQLVWYRALFAASRMRYFIVIIGKGRENAKRRVQERIQRNVTKTRNSTLAPRCSDSDSDSESPVEEVRKYCNMLKKPDKHQCGSATHTTGVGQSHACPTPRLGKGQPLGHDNHAMGGRGSRAHRLGLAPGERQKHFINDISQTLGRQLQLHTPPPVEPEKDTDVLGDDELHNKRARALADVNEHAQIITISPEEISKLRESYPGRTEEIGSSRFKQFYFEKRQKAADALIRREEAKQHKIETSTGIVTIKITKRYLLQFFENWEPELPWLPLMQSLMLVIHGKAHFHTAHEQHVFQEKLRSFNEVRKAAQKRPGLFSPIEASLWSHPVILNLALKLQRAMCRGDGALAWKSALFDGCFEESSDRDASGTIIYSAARQGNENSHYLRKLAEVSGQFAIGTSNGSPPPLAAELTPFQVTNAATTTANGYVVRTFGDRETEGVPSIIVRPCNRALDLPHDVRPRDVRIETLRRKRRARDALKGPRQNNPLIAHGDMAAQRRYGDWMMRSDVPAASQAAKQEMLPFFEGLASPTSDTFSAPQASLSYSSTTVDEVDAPSQEQQSSRKDKDKAKSPTNVEATVGSRQQTQPGKLGTSGHTGPVSAPQTAEEVGKLFMQMDALQTILEVDSSEIGGFAHRCPAGWKSGYRVEPMSKGEIRRAHIVQKFCAARESL